MCDFTNKAARNAKIERNFIKGEAGAVRMVGNLFHSISVKLLRRHADIMS